MEEWQRQEAGPDYHLITTTMTTDLRVASVVVNVSNLGSLNYLLLMLLRTDYWRHPNSHESLACQRDQPTTSTTTMFCVLSPLATPWCVLFEFFLLY